MNSIIYDYIFNCGVKIVGWENSSICLKDVPGNKYWYLNGLRHRVNGPAVEYISGGKTWYLNDKRYTEEEFNTIQSMEKK